MNCEELMIAASKCTDKKQKAELVEEVYFANIGLTITLMKEFCRNPKYYDDFMQVAYEAMYKACNCFGNNQDYSALSYYRMCLKHESYCMWLKSGEAVVNHEVEIDTKNLDMEKHNKMYRTSEAVEQMFMDSFLWERVKAVLSEQDATIIKERFYKDRTLSSIGSDYTMTAEAVRQRIVKSCKRLRQDEGVVDVAVYYHYL